LLKTIFLKEELLMKGKSVIKLVLSLIVIAGAIYLAINGVGTNNTAGAEDIKLGLDLAGGVSVTYKTVIDDPTATEMSDTIYKLKKRTDQQGYIEADIYQEGSNRINVDIPGVEDANAVLEELGEPGSLEFIDEDGDIIVTGNDVLTATTFKDSSDLSSPYKIQLELNDEGKEKFSQGTLENKNKIIYIVYNDEVVMSPTVNDQISNGIATISGFDSYEEADEIAAIIRIGALPLELEELRSNVVGATLGQDAINTSLLAGLLGLGFIFLFMIVIYRVPGLVATFALGLYASLMIICISIFNVTLTLPGIAGIILSIGMAVDANVIIFARVREELASGKTIKAAVKSGFEKATSAILDGNVTTLIASIVLYLMGTGTIKGFAITLGLGIIVSMFTALVVTRILLTSIVGIFGKNKTLYGVAHSGKTIQVVEKRRIWFAVSIIVIAVGIIMMPVNYVKDGSILNYDIEFAGGTSTIVSVDDDSAYDSYEALETDLKELVVTATGDETPQFQNVKDVNQFIIKTYSLTQEQRLALQTALTEKYQIGTDSIEMETISATISSEMRRDAIIAVVIAAICILLYITFRFHDFRFGLSAVIALMHDILVVFTVYSVLGIAINNSFIAAMLTIVGYSINDTIVLFDRVRENQKSMKRGDFKGVVDLSISQTIGRSINTSLTTFVMVLMLYMLGVASIKEFALPLMVGILSGTYSSIFIASPLWFLFKKKEEAK
jgi:SecD/SecF fusion protein